MDRLSQRHALFTGGAIAALALAGTAGAALGQDESEATAQGHPLHIHSGSCGQVGDVIFPLGEISSDLMVHGEPAADDPVGSVTEQDLALNVTVVEATIDDLTGEDHLINIHESEEAMDVHIACGDIGGTRIDGDMLVIRLSPVDDSGYIGFGLLSEGDDGNTTVYSLLTQVEAMTATTEPEPAEESPDAMESPAAESPDAVESPGAMESPDAVESPGAVESPDAVESPAAESPDAMESPAFEEDGADESPAG